MNTLTLESTNLRMRRLGTERMPIENIAHLLTDPKRTKYLSFKESPLTMQAAMDFMRTNLPWLISKKDGGSAAIVWLTEADPSGCSIMHTMGAGGLHESDYDTLVEAGRLAARVAFDRLSIRRLGTQVAVSNTTSIRLAEGVGFVKEGCLRAAFMNGQVPEDVIIYGLLSGEVKPCP